MTSGAFFGHRLSFLAAAIGIVSLAWAARLFAVTVQRGIRIIWAAAGKRTLVQENAVSLLIELVTLLAMVALIAAGEGARLAARAVTGIVGAGAARAIVEVGSAREAAGSEGGVGIRGAVFPVPPDGVRGLPAVHRGGPLRAAVRGLARTRRAGGAVSRLERALFMEPARLLRSFGRTLQKGDVLFSAGDRERSAYFVYYGRIGIYIPSRGLDSAIASLGPGEVFGEMAYILGEDRTATARAQEESAVLELPPSIFEQYLASHPDAARNLIASLSERLRTTDVRIHGDAKPDGGAIAREEKSTPES